MMTLLAAIALHLEVANPSRCPCGEPIVASEVFPQGAAFIQGWGGTRWIVVSPDLIEVPADELAFVVAHEMAHNFTGSEIEADAIAAAMMRRAGYDPRAGIRLLRRFKGTGWLVAARIKRMERN